MGTPPPLVELGRKEKEKKWEQTENPPGQRSTLLPGTSWEQLTQPLGEQRRGSGPEITHCVLTPRLHTKPGALAEPELPPPCEEDTGERKFFRKQSSKIQTRDSTNNSFFRGPPSPASIRRVLTSHSPQARYRLLQDREGWPHLGHPSPTLCSGVRLREAPGASLLTPPGYSVELH